MTEESGKSKGLKRLLIAGLLVGLLTVVVSACGSSGSGSSSSSSGSETTSSSSGGTTSAASQESGGDLAQAEATITALSKTSGRKFPEPPGKYDPGTGKLAIVTCGNAGVTCLLRAEIAQEAAAAMGWTAPTIFDGEFSPAKQSGYIEQATREGYDGIMLIGIDTSTVKAAIDAAAEAEIPIGCVPCEDSEKSKVIDVSPSGLGEGEAVGTYAAVQLKNEGNVLLFEDTAFPVSIARAKGAKGALEKYCPACDIETIPFPTSDVSKPGPPTWTAALASHPAGSVNFAIAPYDAAAAPMAKTAVERGREEIRITGSDGLPEFRDLIGKNPTAAATAESSEGFASWATVDLIARKKAGAELWNAESLPVVLVTEENVGSSDFDQETGFWEPKNLNYKKEFEQSWSK